MNVVNKHRMIRHDSFRKQTVFIPVNFSQHFRRKQILAETLILSRKKKMELYIISTSDFNYKNRKNIYVIL